MTRLLFLACALLSAAACSPKLLVRNEDPRVPYAQVRVDGESRGFVSLNDDLSLRVERGYHRVEATPRGETGNPWADDGVGWTIYVDRRARVTLLPRPAP